MTPQDEARAPALPLDGGGAAKRRRGCARWRQRLCAQGRRRQGALDQVARKKTLRTQTTPHERAMWRLLHEGELAALNWRKQAPFGGSVLDFVSHPARLVVEVDGAQHAQAGQALHDAQRTAALEREGYRVLRFWNVDVVKAKTGVWDAIYQAAMQTAAHRRMERWRRDDALRARIVNDGGSHPLGHAARDSSPIEGEQ
ncbi:MAG: DUF559 domain-containing protein [Terricaulis sp.]|nr:DUF559 domain-containing protein [Terricaulis sp.]